MGALGDERIALQLYRTHRAALVSYASGITGSRAHAEDVVQEAWLRIEQAERGRPLERPLNYLYRIVRNLALDGGRHRTVEQRYFQGDADQTVSEIPEGRSSAEDALIAQEDLKRVLAALAELPERTRTAIEMHRFGGCKLKEIAEHLGISLSMAHHLIKDGVRQCQRAL
jgi:RNA polymerase sigma factor (sigma-70 family)